MIKKFKEYVKKFKNNYEIDYINSMCEVYGIKNYSINSDYSIDVNENVYLDNKKLKKLPLKFGQINGSFHINNNELTTLEGCPHYVSGDCIFTYNKLTTLEGSPEYVDVPNFQFNDNNIYTLKGAPKIKGVITHYSNPITELFIIFYIYVYSKYKEKIFDAWNLYDPVYEKEGKWYVYDYRLRELYIDVTGEEYGIEFPEFENYILDRT